MEIKITYICKNDKPIKIITDVACSLVTGNKDVGLSDYADIEDVNFYYSKTGGLVNRKICNFLEAKYLDFINEEINEF